VIDVADQRRAANFAVQVDREAGHQGAVVVERVEVRVLAADDHLVLYRRRRCRRRPASFGSLRGYE
jgi:hypothetical protein